MKKDVVAAALENREYLYRYLWRLFAAEPDEALMALIGSEDTIAETALFFGNDADGTAVQESLASLAAVYEGSAEDLESLRSTYTRFFVGPKAPPVMPWESSYVETEGLLFQKSTLNVRQAYRDAGFEAAGYPREPDDFIATELNFMASLIEESEEALKTEDDEAMAVLFERQKRFLGEHLCAWLPSYAAKLEVRALSESEMFYALAARLAAVYCQGDKAVVEELIAG